MRKVMTNTTPLIALSNINQLELLQKLYGTIIILQAVMDDLIRDGLFISDVVQRYVLKEAGE
jgi:predicted nucleic acid-binding protein